LRREASRERRHTPLLETPQAISVVTRQQLDDQQPQTVIEAFRYSSGVVPEPFGTAAHYTDQYMKIRGFAPDIYLDGLKLPPFSSTDPYFLERAEIVHGPASVLYGQSSPGGLVDLASKLPTEKPINEINFGGGTFDRCRHRSIWEAYSTRTDSYFTASPASALPTTRRWITPKIDASA
jgi:iron complex outermembrane recepter protein